MNFTRINNQGVRSDDGYVVQGKGRFSAEYREGPRKITVCREGITSPDGVACDVICSDAFKEWDEPDSAAIDPEKQREILHRYTKAMEFLGLKVVCEDA